MRFRETRPSSLDQERVVRTALALLDQVGLDGLTMRRLADELGVQAASLYWHLRDKEELLDLLADAICREMPTPRREGSWRQQLTAFALDYRRALQSHRDAAPLLASRLQVGTSAARLLEAVVGPLLEAGFEPGDAAEAGFLIANYVPRFTAEPGGEARVGTAEAPEAPTLGSARSGRLEFVSGATRVTIRADPSMRSLYRTSFEGRGPEITVDGGTLRVSQRHGRKGSGELVLNGSIPWAIAMRGGAVRVTAELSGLDLSSFEVSGGTGLLNLTLPAPSGTVSIRFSGGMSRAEIHRPEGVPAQLRVSGGVAKLTLDESSFGGIGGETRLQSADYKDATDRYDIEVLGGAARLIVDTGAAVSAAGQGSAQARSRGPGQLQDLPSDQYPSLAVVAEHLAAPDVDARFRFGLEVLLDGLERRLSR